MNAVGRCILVVAACSACHAPAAAQEAADLPRGAIRRLGSVNLRHDSVLSAVFTPDGSRLITGGRDIRVWESKSRRLVRTIPLEEGYVRQMHVTADGKTLFAFPDLTGCVLVFDLESGKRITRIAAKEKNLAFTTFAVSPDGRTIAAGSFTRTDRFDVERRAELTLWNVATGEKIRTFPGHKRMESLGAEFKTYLAVDSLVFSRDGKLLASLSSAQDDAVRVFDVATGRERHALRRFPLVTGGLGGLTLTPEGRLAVVSAEGRDLHKAVVSYWNMETGKRETEVNTAGTSWFHAYSADGKWMAGLGQQMEVHVWDRQTRAERYAGGRRGGGGPVLFSKDGDTLVVCRGAFVELIDLKTGRDILLEEGHSGKVRTLDVNQDGSAIVSGGDDGAVLVWDVKTGKPRRLIDLGGNGAWSVAFSPSGKNVAAANHFSQVIVWDSASGKEQHRFSVSRPDDFARYATRIAFAPDGKTLGVATSSRTAYEFFDTKTGAPTLNWRFGQPLGAANVPFCFSPDGKRFAGLYSDTGPDGRVALWDMSENPPHVIGGDREGVLDMAFSPDGEYLAWSTEKRVRLWDLREGKELKTFKSDPASHCLAFSPDGRYLVSGRTFHPLNFKARPLALPIQPSRFAFSRDGRALAAVAEDGFTLLVFEMSKLAK
ncbi:MAG: WD40 repeat domain-containing protein [Gemmataceae bacterium]